MWECGRRIRIAGMAQRTAQAGGVFVGTSGYVYDHWKGTFYPSDLPQGRRFEYYACHFATVELNATFYHLFKDSTFAKWQAQAPAGFVYAVKMWRRITHRKRLHDTAADVQTFLERAILLQRHLGPVLVQLPPGLHREDGRLEDFLAVCTAAAEALKKPLRFAVEFRHSSWFEEAVYGLLRKYNAALVLPDMPRLYGIRECTTDFIYIRFHGRPQLYQSLYSADVLTDWVRWLEPHLHSGTDVYAYFNNDGDANACKNAAQLHGLLTAKR